MYSSIKAVEVDKVRLEGRPVLLVVGLRVELEDLHVEDAHVLELDGKLHFVWDLEDLGVGVKQADEGLARNDLVAFDHVLVALCYF